MYEQTFRFLRAFFTVLLTKAKTVTTLTSFKIRFDKIFNLSEAILVTGRRTSKLPYFLDNRLTDGGVVVSLTLLCNFYCATFFFFRKIENKMPLGRNIVPYWHMMTRRN
jgi:hypothetical protein